MRLQAEAHAVAGRRLRAVVRAAAEAGEDADAAETIRHVGRWNADDRNAT